MEEESRSYEINGGAVSLRRRRMEIRRIKMLTNANVFVEQPVSKRLRPVSGVSYNVQREGEEDDDDVDVVQEGDDVMMNHRDNALLCASTSTCSDSASRLSVVREPGRAASSLSTAWERPSGGQSVLAFCSLNAENTTSSSSCGR